MKRVAIPQRLQGGAIEEAASFSKYVMVWRVWLHTNDWVHGTFLLLYQNGMIERVTVREDEGDDIVVVKPANT